MAGARISVSLRRAWLIHRHNPVKLNLALGNLDSASPRLARVTFGGSMSGRRVSPFSETAEIACRLAAKATNSIANNKILLLGAFAPLVVTVAMFVRADVPSLAAKGTLNCYDSAGNHEPCAMLATASSSQLEGRTIGSDQTASWTKTVLYQQAILPTSLYQQVIWPTTAAEQPATVAASAPTARSSSTPGRRSASTVCGRRLIPCFFSALRRGFTRLASAAATVGQPRAAREHL